MFCFVSSSAPTLRFLKGHLSQKTHLCLHLLISCIKVWNRQVSNYLLNYYAFDRLVNWWKTVLNLKRQGVYTVCLKCVSFTSQLPGQGRCGSSSWTAAKETSRRTYKLDEEGMEVAVCRHGFLLKALNMFRGQIIINCLLLNVTLYCWYLYIALDKS